MDDFKLTHAHKHSLECFVETKDRPINFVEVFRLYIPNICQTVIRLGIVGFFLFFFLPSKAEIPLNILAVCCIASVLAYKLLDRAITAYHSLGHWELMKQVLDWKRVEKLHQQEVQDPS